jgi:hypothetical protein
MYNNINYFTMRNIITIFLIGSAFLFTTCKKKEQTFDVSLTGLYYSTTYPAKYWIIFHEAGGKVLDVQRFFPENGSHDYHFSTNALDADAKCYLTVASHRTDNDFLALVTMPDIARGSYPYWNYLSPGIASDSPQLFCDLTIKNAPETEYMTCSSGSQVLLFQGGTNLKALFSTYSGGAGLALALKPKNEIDPRYYWLPENGRTYFTDTLDYNAFRTDWLSTDFTFPYKSRWNYAVSGITDEGDPLVFGNLDRKEANNSEPLTDHFTIHRPGDVPFKKLWVSASDVINGKDYTYTIPVSETYAFPDVLFGVNSLNYQSGSRVYCSTEGNFDALQISLYGDGGKAYWSIEGAPADVKSATIPQVPDSLKQQWPKLNAFTVGYTVCGDYDGIDGFAQLRQVDLNKLRRSSYWGPQRGYRAQFKHW